MSKMNIPGFTAEASLYRTPNCYTETQGLERQSDPVEPQTHLWPPVYNQCTWLIFCCIEYDDLRCCKEFHERCLLL